jgi:glycosyltransferase involved in cell wall biosynthesis
MIVKNEALRLPRLFASLRGAIDFFVISDTGSTDDTLATIASLSAQYAIPGMVTSHPWKDFSHNRNLALHDVLQARREGRHTCDRVMILDADEELLVADPGWKPALKNGVTYLAYVRSGRTSVARVFLPWLEGQTWQWVGRIHNVLENEDIHHPFEFSKSVSIRSHEFQGAKSHAFANGAEKARADATTLASELEGKTVDKSMAHRFLQLGLAYENAGDWSSAIACLGKVGDCDEAGTGKRYVSWIIAARCAIQAGVDPTVIRGFIAKATLLDASRWEANYYDALLHRKQGNLKEALCILDMASERAYYDKGTFFLEHDIYEWKLDYDRAFLAAQRKDDYRALQIVVALLENDKVPDIEKRFLSSLNERLLKTLEGQIRNPGNQQTDYSS